MAESASTARVPVDVHVHIVGNGKSGSGCFIDLKGVRKFQALYMVRHLGLPLSVLENDLDGAYVNKLLEFVRSSSLRKIVILAHDKVYDSLGREIPGFGSFYVPNDYVLELANAHSEFIPAVSIHPAREDALEELERCIAGGARIMKCLPNCHNINCNDPRYSQFWSRMAKAGMPLLAHTEGELSVPVMNREYQDPRVLELPLRCGVRVIAAHASTASHPFDSEYGDVLSEMMGRYPSLYCDNSALCTPFRSARLMHVRKEPFADRMIHGSDLPIPVSGMWLLLRRLIDWKSFRKIEQEKNVLERDYQFKKALGFSEESFTRIHSLLLPPEAA